MTNLDISLFKDFIEPLTPASKTGVNCFGVCKTKRLKEDYLCFINGAGPMKEFLESHEKNKAIDLEKITFIIDRQFYEKKKDDLNVISEDRVYLTTEFDRSICEVSKWFYDCQKKDQQHLVDGRQTGDCSIDPTARISQNVFIGENVQIASDVTILPGCVIMSNVSIGEGVIIYPNCVIYPETNIGAGCIIHAGSVIGSDGYGYNFLNGSHQKVWHIGGVEIGENVEIGANCTIDRGTFDNTIIEEGSKLDNLVHIAHNCHLKKKVIVCAQSGLAGSSTIGNYTAMSGHVAIAPGVEVGDQVEIVGHSAVFDNVESKSRVAGSPARPMKEWLRSIMAVRRLTKKG